jgi:hypothetical protein
MTYYIANDLELDTVICDDCGDSRWEQSPRYGTNVDSRLAEFEATGVRWGWVPLFSSDATPCLVCGKGVK